MKYSTTQGIPEADLPVKKPSGAANIRYEENGKSYKSAMPDVVAAAAIVQQEIDGIIADGEERLNQLVADAQSDIDAIVGGMGYLPPVAFASGLNVDSSRFTVTYDGVTYAPVADAIPFTTTGTFDPGQWRVIQGVTRYDLKGIAEETVGELNLRFLPPGADVAQVISDAFVECAERGLKLVYKGAGVVNCTSPIVIVRGVDADFTGTYFVFGSEFSGSAVTFSLENTKSKAVITGMSLRGPNYGGIWSDTDVDGLDFSGAEYGRPLAEITFDNLDIEGFRHARVYGSNVYINTFRSSRIVRNYSSFYSPAGLTNVGEKTLDIDCLIAENQWAYITYSALDIELHSVSMDYQRAGDIDASNSNSGRVKMIAGNWEWGTAWQPGPRILTPASAIDGAQRSGFVSFSNVRIQVREPSEWPTGVPLISGASDVVIERCHVWGIGRSDEPLGAGGGRVSRIDCTYSRVPTQSWDSGRALNRNGSFEQNIPIADLFCWVRGVNNTDAVTADTISVARTDEDARTGDYSLKISPFFGAGSVKEVWFAFPVYWGDIPFVRAFIKPTTTPGGNLFNDLYYGTLLGFGSDGVPKFGQLQTITSSTFLPVGGEWTKIIRTISTPEDHAAPRWATHVLFRISMNATKVEDGAIYLDDVHFDVAGGRRI